MFGLYLAFVNFTERNRCGFPPGPHYRTWCAVKWCGNALQLFSSRHVEGNLSSTEGWYWDIQIADTKYIHINVYRITPITCTHAKRQFTVWITGEEKTSCQSAFRDTNILMWERNIILLCNCRNSLSVEIFFIILLTNLLPMFYKKRSGFSW